MLINTSEENLLGLESSLPSEGNTRFVDELKINITYLVGSAVLHIAKCDS